MTQASQNCYDGDQGPQHAFAFLCPIITQLYCYSRRYNAAMQHVKYDGYSSGEL